MTKRIVRLALLLCDTPAEYGTYYDIYKEWLLKAQASYPDADVAQNTELLIDAYDVVDKKEYPPAERLSPGHPEAYDAIMMTGSKHTSYDPNSAFAPQLIEFVRKVVNERQHLPVLCVCFGHQIAALALDGECCKGTNGWEVGVYSNNFTKEGRYWWSDSVVEDGADKIYVEQMHKDHVPSVPPGCQLLLTSERYPVHSFVKLHPASTPEKPLAQVLTIQGHPEFTPEIVHHMVNTRAEQGIFDGPTTAEARRRLGGKDGKGAEGHGRLGWAMWRVMLQQLPK